MMFFIKLWVAIHVGVYRLSGGKIGGAMRGFKVLLLTTTGRKSGKLHIVPLGFFEQPGGYLITGSNNGLPTHPAWYHNLKNKPQATIQIGRKVTAVTAEILTGEARALAWQKIITASPAYAGYEKKTGRQIPVVFLRP
jgi:deazaflavin-dependent oxidoreductase (nitroreductase family)